MPLDVNNEYNLAPPKQLTESESLWQQMYADFLANGVPEQEGPTQRPPPDISPYRPPGGTGAAPAASATGSIVIPAAGGAGGNTPPPSPGPGEEGRTGEQSAVPGPDGYDPNAGVDPRAGTGTGNPPNPVDGQQRLIDGIREHFPMDPNTGTMMEGPINDPGRFEQFMAVYGDEAIMALGLLTSTPGLGWLAKKVQDWYWRKNQWANPADKWRPVGGDINEGINEFLGTGGEQSSPLPPPETGTLTWRDPGGSSMGIFGPSSVLNFASRIKRKGK